MKQHSIRQQVTWLTFVPLLIVMIGMEAYFINNRFSDMDKNLLDQGELIVHQLAASSEYGVFSNNQAFLQNIASRAMQQPDVRGAAVLNSASEILVSVGEFSHSLKGQIIDKSLATNEYAKQQALASIEEMDNAIILQPPTNSGARSVWLYHLIIPAQIALDEGSAKPIPKPMGAVIVELSKNRHEGHKTRMLWTTLAITTLFLAFVLYLVSLASRSIIDPIHNLSKAVQEIGKGKLDTRVSSAMRINELATLAQGLNETTAHLQQERATLQHRIDEATQALRLKKDDAERASLGKSHFLAVASHDLRQPLHALGLYIAELQRRVSGTEQQRLVEQAEHSIEALSTLLNALLDISKLDAGAISAQIQPCNLAAMLEHIGADCRMLANQKNIRLIIRPFHGYVKSDPQLLERILMNLVSNAIRYTRQNGCVLIACRKRGAYLRIEVRDNGVGISKTDQENIFLEFFQIAQSQLDANKGLGLGLSIVDRLVKLLGHRMELCSEPDNGSIFSLMVKIVDNADKATIQAQTDSVHENDKLPLHGKKILVVDDDKAVLSSTFGLLCSWGGIVSQADSFAQVKQLLSDGAAWDFIVSDYQLGCDNSGIDVIALIRQHYNKPIPCILISGDTSPAVLKLANINGHHLLQKPVKPGKLRSLIVHLLEPHQNLGE